MESQRERWDQLIEKRWNDHKNDIKANHPEGILNADMKLGTVMTSLCGKAAVYVGRILPGRWSFVLDGEDIVYECDKWGFASDEISSMSTQKKLLRSIILNSKPYNYKDIVKEYEDKLKELKEQRHVAEWDLQRKQNEVILAKRTVSQLDDDIRDVSMKLKDLGQ